jgi:competence protein ComEC
LHTATPDPLAELASLEPGEVVIVGGVASPAVASSWGYRADVRVEHLWYEGREVLRGGGVEVFAGDLSVGVGDRVRVEGEILRPETGEDGFDYAKYLSTKRISAVIEATSVWPVDENLGLIGRVYRRTDAALGYGLHPQEAAVVRGMVLGDRSLIPEELEEDFRRSGITHVLAISGQHVAVLAGVIYFALRMLLPAVLSALRTLTTLVLIWVYIVLAGAPPSAIRAGVVATLVLAAGLLGRQVSPL